MTTIDEALRRATATLMGASGSPRADAQSILAHVLERPREYLIAHGDERLTDLHASILAKLIQLRVHGMPLPYILGRRAFYDRTFRVTSHVLIPRPETEHVVETALAWAREHGGSSLRLIDIGTGSGAIAVTLAAHLPGCTVYGTDISAAALLVAQENGADLPNLRLVQSDLLAALRGPFDVICANLPYIATGDLSVLDVAKFEPHVALDGGPDGLVLIRRLLADAPARLKTPGLLLLEHGADQGAAVLALARATFPAADVSLLKDLGGLDRVVAVRLR